MTIQIYDSKHQPTEWAETLKKLPSSLQDVYFTAGYFNVVNNSNSSQSLMFVFQIEDNLWVYPFILNKIDRIGSCALTDTLYDIESQYGYGGPLANTLDKEFIASATQAFSSWCFEKGVVAEFSRFHPLINNDIWVGENTEVIQDRKTVSINIESGNDFYASFTSKTKNMLRRADREGVQVLLGSTGDEFQEFKAIYLQTMNRLGSDAFYEFNDQFFDSLEEFYKAHGFLLLAVKAGEVLSAALFLRGKHYLHYHLSGTKDGCRVPGVTNKLLFEAASIGQAEGLSLFHLGGGTSTAEDDTLLRFKSTMGRNRHDYRIGKCIHNEEEYEKLSALWRETFPDLVATFGNRILCYRYSSN